MVITFPRFGDSHIYGRLLFREIGVKFICPGKNSQRGLEQAATKCPEEICLPFKLMVDNLMKAWEAGADTAIMPATMGPCRLGEYGELLKVVLDQQGCRFDWILLDSVSAIGINELKRRLKYIAKDSACHRNDVVKALKGIYSVIKGFEHLEAIARMQSGYEIDMGKSLSVVNNCRKKLEQASGIKKAKEIITESEGELNNISLDLERNPLRLILTGEIFTSIEPFGNHYIEERLMRMGVSFEKNMSIGWWIDNNIVNPLGGWISERKKNHLMPHRIGGYAKETVYEAIRYKDEHFDGIIHLLPVGCMPEIVAKSVFDGLSRREGLPVLSIVFDEMSGEAGYITRIEAFIDMLNRRKIKGDSHVLSGN